MFNNTEYQKQYRIRNRELLRLKGRKYYLENKKDILRKDHERRLLKPKLPLLSTIEKIKRSRESRKKWKRKNPLKVIADYKKRGDYFYRWALSSWSKVTRDRDNNVCQNCGKEGTLAHHLLFKSLYPELKFNLNNGITLCGGCHRLLHWGLT